MKITLQQIVLEIETYLADNYQFRNNLLSGKTEFRTIAKDSNGPWQILTDQSLNTIIRKAELEEIGSGAAPRQFIKEYILSDATPNYDPIKDFLEGLPAWDGKNHVGELFSRIPGISSEQTAWCAVWFRSAVAHWLHLDAVHGNETVPVIIGDQGCGKSTFANQLLPEPLRCYFLDGINFGNKFDRDMALTHNLFVNIDEFDQLGKNQQAKLKHTLSRPKVNGRPIYGCSQEDRVRYASFIGTTNDVRPLTDPTGSRRYICLRVPHGQFIQNQQPLDYEQLYAQALYEVKSGAPYWFSAADVKRIQQANLPFFKTEDIQSMLLQFYRLPDEGERSEMVSGDSVFEKLQCEYPDYLVAKPDVVKSKIGKILKTMGCKTKRTRFGMAYELVPLLAA